MTKEFKLGDKVEAFGEEYVVVGLSMMVHDEDCVGEPEWKITHEIQEVAIAKFYETVSYQKPAWVKPEVLALNNEKKQ